MPSFDTQQRAHILGEEVDNSSSPTITLPSNFLATEHWADLVKATEHDGREYGYLVGINRQNEPVLSNRQGGYAAVIGEDGREIEQASLSIPVFPFGLLSARQVKKAVLVHTHPMPTFKDCPRTRTFSDQDIGQFFGSDYLAMVALDEGGVHLMAKKTRFTRDSWSLLNPKLVEAAIIDVRENSRSMRDVLSRVAHQLSAFGIGYYYTPSLSQPDDTVKFQNLRQAKAVLS